MKQENEERWGSIEKGDHRRKKDTIGIEASFIGEYKFMHYLNSNDKGYYGIASFVHRMGSRLRKKKRCYCCRSRP